MSKPQDRSSIRVFLVDDHPVMLVGLRETLRAPGIEVVGAARSGRDAIAQILATEPDVVLLDLCLPDLRGTEVLKRVKAGAPGVAVILCTSSPDPGCLLDAVAGGAADFIMKNQEEDDILDRVRRVAAGERCLSEDVWRDLFARLSKARLPQVEGTAAALTERDLLILRSFARGISNAKLEKVLGVGPDTVRFHVKNLFKKIDTSDRTQAVVKALKLGLICLEEI